MVEDKEEEELVWEALHVVRGFLLVVTVRVSGGACCDLGWLELDPKVESCWVLGKAMSMLEIDVAILLEWNLSQV